MRSFIFILFIFFGFVSFSQDTQTNYRSVKVAVTDTIVIDTVSINPARFELLDQNNKVITPNSYKVNFEKGEVYLSKDLQKFNDSLVINYLKYPSFLTKTYSLLDQKIISNSTGAIDKLYTLQQSTRENTFTPFEGLNTSGSISRGVTVGNNQNAVVNSELDFQITGKLSEKVSIRASIQDANIPTQEGGYTQNLNEFDQIFMELYSDDWSIRAGDVDLLNDQSFFGKFQKKIQGILITSSLTSSGSKATLFGSGGVVRGVFARSELIGQEGNQGPYKLIGPNGELFVLIISGSERVFINGVLLQRGENSDYVIDYNAGEIRFNPTFPITSEMRITIEYQYSDRNYTRFIGYGGGHYQSNKLDLQTYGYVESDLKNQPLQQNLTPEQVDILQQAGDDPSQMVAPSAVPDTFSENKILYKKDVFEGQEIFVFSNNPEDELFQVRFTEVGENQGNYVVSNSATINRIFEFIPPVDGVSQGNFEPVIQLFAPSQIQLGGLQGTYRPTDKTSVGFEIAASKKDLNLFSVIDDNNNTGIAVRAEAFQKIIDKNETLKLDTYLKFNFIDSNFNTIERLYNVEFNRDWSIESPLGNQRFLVGGVRLANAQGGFANYEFQQLHFSENFEGNRHVIHASGNLGKSKNTMYASVLNSKGADKKSQFYRFNLNTIYDFNTIWVGGKLALEDQQQRILSKDSLSPLSQAFIAYEAFAGVGDSTAVFLEMGYRSRVNDSLRNNSITKVNQSNDYYLKSQLLKTENTQLSIFANYRELQNVGGNRQKEPSLNSRVLFNQRFLKGGIQWNTNFETNSGVLPQQEFTFVEVEPGQGTHIWIDYNNNSLQDLEEFELAQFPDEATFIRVLLPNQVFVKIHQNKLGQILTINPAYFSKNETTKNILSRFYNQTSFLVDRKTKREGNNFDINPFVGKEDDQLGLALNLRNVVFYNRGKQRYTTSYTFTDSRSENLLSVGLQKNGLQSHQINFTHKMGASWLVNFKTQLSENQSTSANFEQRNFKIDSYDLAPKLSYLFSENAQFSVFYQLANKENLIGDNELLKQQKVGFDFTFNKLQKFSINGNVNYISNNFTGNAFSPVAFQMLEGLQPNKNFTWSLLFQRSISKYLDVNISYAGRKSENSNTIHTGTVQLKAFF